MLGKELGNILSDLVWHTLIDCIAEKCEFDVTASAHDLWNDVNSIHGICQMIASKVKYDIIKPGNTFIKVKIDK